MSLRIQRARGCSIRIEVAATERYFLIALVNFQLINVLRQIFIAHFNPELLLHDIFHNVLRHLQCNGLTDVHRLFQKEGRDDVGWIDINKISQLSQLVLINRSLRNVQLVKHLLEHRGVLLVSGHPKPVKQNLHESLWNVGNF